MIFEEELRASGSCDREVVAHLMEAVIFNNGQPKEDFDNVIGKQTLDYYTEIN